MGQARRAIVIMALTLVSCTSRGAPADTPDSQNQPLRLYATTATLPLARQLTNAYMLVNPSVTFDVIAGNFDAIYERVKADQNSYFLTNHLPSEPIWAAPIGQDGIAVIVNPQNPVQALTRQQIFDIYRGNIGSWQDVGGDDREIIVYSREDGSGTRAEFERLLIGDDAITRLAVIAPSSDAMIDAVGREVGAVGYVSMSYLDSRVRALAVEGVLPSPQTVADNTYPLRSILYIAGLTEPVMHYRAFIFWIQSPAGQQIIGRRYAPLLAP